MNEPARSIAGDPRWELAQRVAGSNIFARGPALRRFLLFVCESALQGQETAIKEQQIGHHVLGRPADYNAAEDNIVRVRARELRRKLEEYFKEEGKEEPVVILLPKGGYVPLFEARQSRTSSGTLSVRPEKRRIQIFPWAVSVLLGVACAVLIARDLGRPTASDGGSPHNAVDRFWNQLMPPGEQALVVAADSNFVILQDVARKSVSLDDYIHQKYLAWPEFRDQPLAAIATRQYTGIGEVHVLLRILRTRPDFPQRIRFRFARDLDLRELKTSNAIIMGARRSNPWVELFEPRCRFVFRWDAERNK